MARYFFHLRDGIDRLIDAQGFEIKDIRAMKAIALKEARSLISQEALLGHINLSQRLEIEDQSGTIIHTIQLADAVSIIPHIKNKPL